MYFRRHLICFNQRFETKYNILRGEAGLGWFSEHAAVIATNSDKLTVSYAKVSTPSVEESWEKKLVAEDSHSTEIDLAPPEMTGTMTLCQMDSLAVIFVMGFSVSDIHCIRSLWHVLKTGQGRDYFYRKQKAKVYYENNDCKYNDNVMLLEFYSIYDRLS